MQMTNAPHAPSDQSIEPDIGERSQRTFETAVTVFPGGTTHISVERDPTPR